MANHRTRLCLFAVVFAALFVGALCADVADLTDSPQVDEGVATGHSKATDAGSIQREAESMAAVAARAKARAGAQAFTFQAEVTRLMDILINSLYTNKDIFLRELISNASDALDKIRFLALTDKSQLGEGEVADLEIRIWLDKEKQVLYLRDRGIGMTKEDLVKNLGTIAKSGTSAFLESMQKGGDVNLIGQFGVGFYSVYLVADWVEVVSKHNDDKQWIWSSGADGSFTVAEDDFSENEPLGRGTLLKIHLKPEAQRDLSTFKLKELVTRYSEFINFPIYLLTTKEVEVPVEEEEAEEDTTEEATEDDKEDEEKEGDGVEDEEEEEEEEAPKPPKTRKEERDEWERLNDNRAIWLRTPKDVTKDEYQNFYKAISKDYADALTWTHFKAEGDVEFKSLLYIPKNAPYNYYDKYYEKPNEGGLKLYVRRVFISDDVLELLPRYLSFVKGLVDSDTLPLNVNREMLQTDSSLKTIKKKLVRKILDLVKRMADDEVQCQQEDKENKEEELEKDSEEAKAREEKCGAYATFYGQFGRVLKMGIMEDTTNRVRLARLMRFYTSKSTDKLTSLDEYISRMKDGQQHIYFLAGTSKEEVQKSPMLERLVQKGYEVVFFSDVLDEYVMQHMTEFEDKKFADASKDDLTLSGQDATERKAERELKEGFKDLGTWWKKVLGEKVSAVKVSNRLATTPCVVVAAKWGQSANMERIMKAQAFSDPARASYQQGQRSLEINPRHPLIKSLRDKVQEDDSSTEATSMARLLFETALLESGYSPDNLKEFSERVYSLAAEQMGVDKLDVDPELEDEDSATAEDVDDDAKQEL